MAHRQKAVRELTARQQLFVAEYLTCLNATKAAIAAGYSKKGADVAGPRLLGNVRISAEIAKKTEKRLAKLEVTADNVVQEIARLAFLDPRKFFTEDGRLRPITELDEDTARGLAGMDVEEQFEGRGPNRRQTGVVKKIKLVDKGINLERLGRYLKLFTDKHELTGKFGAPLVPPPVTIKFIHWPPAKNE